MSKLTLSLMCFAVTVLFSGCFTGTGKPGGVNGGPQKPDVVQSLPEGKWYGNGVFFAGQFSQQVSCNIAVGVSNNAVQILMKMADGTQRSEDFRLNYLSQNSAQWISTLGGVIGTCSCMATKCTCTDSTNRFTQSLDFSGGSLNIQESNYSSMPPYGFSGTLSYQE